LVAVFFGGERLEVAGDIPYLRYGIFLGKRDHYPLPGRLFRHGAHFDFMLSWRGYEPDPSEWKSLKDIAAS